ncbi:6932_t:CDS:2 [Gigaspora margarita]|uniref:6932_t:CDS:1 n=1 Tax=Gigaspora margarita TaxID=4874 RepID=A0ABN7UKC7_GIGMA|nr:6932_t:CDS:2 [Gigaspora margarita]
MPCIFCEIAAGNAPAEIHYEDEDIIALNDHNPAANHHILIITKRHVKNIAEFKKEDLELVKKMKDVGTRLITERLGKDESPVTPDKYL